MTPWTTPTSSHYIYIYIYICIYIDTKKARQNKTSNLTLRNYLDPFSDKIKCLEINQNENVHIEIT